MRGGGAAFGESLASIQGPHCGDKRNQKENPIPSFPLEKDGCPGGPFVVPWHAHARHYLGLPLRRFFDAVECLGHGAAPSAEPRSEKEAASLGPWPSRSWSRSVGAAQGGGGGGGGGGHRAGASVLVPPPAIVRASAVSHISRPFSRLGGSLLLRPGGRVALRSHRAGVPNSRLQRCGDEGQHDLHPVRLVRARSPRLRARRVLRRGRGKGRGRAVPAVGT